MHLALLQPRQWGLSRCSMPMQPLQVFLPRPLLPASRSWRCIPQVLEGRSSISQPLLGSSLMSWLLAQHMPLPHLPTPHSAGYESLLGSSLMSWLLAQHMRLPHLPTPHSAGYVSICRMSYTMLDAAYLIGGISTCDFSLLAAPPIIFTSCLDPQHSPHVDIHSGWCCFWSQMLDGHMHQDLGLASSFAIRPLACFAAFRDNCWLFFFFLQALRSVCHEYQRAVLIFTFFS